MLSSASAVSTAICELPNDALSANPVWLAVSVVKIDVIKKAAHTHTAGLLCFGFLPMARTHRTRHRRVGGGGGGGGRRSWDRAWVGGPAARAAAACRHI